MPTLVPMKSEDRRSIIDLHRRKFLHGECYAFAIALHRELGWPIVGLMNGDVPEHVGVRAPDRVLFDAGGHKSEQEFAEDYLPSPFVFKDLHEDDLFAVRPVHDQSILQAIRFAEMIWPDLPWKSTLADRMLSFADALEQLCKQHGIWIIGSVPAQPPIAEVGDGSERGYVLQPTILGTTYTLRRILE